MVLSDEKTVQRLGEIEISVGKASFAVRSWTDGLDPRKAAEKLLADANDGDIRALSWVKRFSDDGVTALIVRQIGLKMRRLPMTVQVIAVPAEKTFEYRIQLQDSGHITDEQFAVLLAFLVVKSGLASRIKTCEFTECKEPYFLGNSKAKYCSNKCGSNVRARKMRKNQKASQMLC